MGKHLQIVIDCANPAKLATFWAEALHYKIQDPPQGYASWPDFLQAQGVPQEEWESASAIVDPEGQEPRIFFQRVPEPKTTKNRLHLDLNASTSTDATVRTEQINAEVERLTKLGARELYRCEERGDSWVTLADPEDNEFCVQ